MRASSVLTQAFKVVGFSPCLEQRYGRNLQELAYLQGPEGVSTSFLRLSSRIALVEFEAPVEVRDISLLGLPAEL
jgi:hypothetical protein